MGKTSAPQAVTLTGCSAGISNCVMSSISGTFYQGFTAVCPGSSGYFVLACVPSGDFTQTNNCPPNGFPPGVSCTMLISFKPERAGARAATLHTGFDQISTPLSNPAGAKVFVGGTGVKAKKKNKKKRKGGKR